MKEMATTDGISSLKSWSNLRLEKNVDNTKLMYFTRMVPRVLSVMVLTLQSQVKEMKIKITKMMM